MAGRFSIEAIFKAKDRFTAVTAKMSSRFAKFARRAKVGLKGANKASDKFLGGLKKIGLAATAAGVALTAGLSSVIKTGAEFEQTLVTAAAKFPDGVKKGTKAFLALEAVAKSVGENTEFAASEAAEGLKFLAMAGFTSEQAIAALPRLVDLATAAETDFAGAVDMASDALGAFGLETKDAAQLQTNLSRVSDVMTKTSNMANTSFAQLFEGFKEAGPVATAAGISIEKLGAMAAGLAQGGIKGSKGGTALKNSILALTAPASAGAKALAGLGVVTEVAGELRDPIDVLADLNTKLKEVGSAKRMQVLSKVFGREAIAGGARMIQLATGQLQEYESDLIKAGGTTQQVAKDVRDATSQDFKSLSSVIESVSIDVFSVIAEDVRKIVQGVTAWVRENKDLIKSGAQKFLTDFKEALPTIIFWLGKIGRVVVFLTALAVGIKVVSAAFAVFNAIMAVSPLGWIVIALVAATALAIAFWPEIKEIAAAVWSWMKQKASEFGDWISGVWDSTKEKTSTVWTSIKDFIGGIWEGIKTIALTALNIFLNFHPLGLIIKHWTPIKVFFAGLWDSVKQMFFDAIEGVMNKMRSVVSFFSGMVDSVKGAIGFDVDGDGESDRSGDEAGGRDRGSAASGANIVSPAERVARSMSESRHSETVDININDNSGGKATVSRRQSGRKPPPGLQPSGAF